VPYTGAMKTDLCKCNSQGIPRVDRKRLVMGMDPVFSEPIPSLLPFVPIMKEGSEAPVIRLALKQLQQDPLLGKLEPLLAFFARFVLENEVVAQIMFA